MHNLTHIHPTHLEFIKLLIAHFAADFLLQTNSMVKNKRWLSKAMFAHIGVVYLTAAIVSFLWWQSLVIAVIHYVIDGLKIQLSKKLKDKDILLFVGDQVLHVLTILVVCAVNFGWLKGLVDGLNNLLQDGKLLMFVLGYLLISYPVGYLIGLSTRKMSRVENSNEEAEDKNGMKIGIFERIIILTFVLLGQFEAIGFLITGKSLLRFASRNEHKKSEYVLLGTMMSYALTIILGVLLNLYLR